MPASSNPSVRNSSIPFSLSLLLTSARTTATHTAECLSSFETTQPRTLLLHLYTVDPYFLCFSFFIRFPRKGKIREWKFLMNGVVENFSKNYGRRIRIFSDIRFNFSCCDITSARRGTIIANRRISLEIFGVKRISYSPLCIEISRAPFFKGIT